MPQTANTVCDLQSLGRNGENVIANPVNDYYLVGAG
jgi:hypothetical protein